MLEKDMSSTRQRQMFPQRSRRVVFYGDSEEKCKIPPFIAHSSWVQINESFASLLFPLDLEEEKMLERESLSRIPGTFQWPWRWRGRKYVLLCDLRQGIPFCLGQIGKLIRDELKMEKYLLHVILPRWCGSLAYTLISWTYKVLQVIKKRNVPPFPFSLPPTFSVGIDSDRQFISS